MKQYKTLLFDLCGTLMQYRTERMPSIEIEGEQVQTTTPLLYACFLEFDRGAISFEKFHADFIKTTEAISIARESRGEEVLSSTRFDAFLDRLNADLGKRRSEIHRLLMEIHLKRVSDCLELLPQHRDLLLVWKKQYKMGLVTNFDDAKTVRELLLREGISELFETVVISAEIGIRKPRKEIFLAACEQMKSPPSETLFVGDSWECDIVGAKSLGLDTAWINPVQGPQNEKEPKVDYFLHNLEALDAIL